MASAPLVEATRGPARESLHYGAVAIVDSSGRLRYRAGDPGLGLFLRSSAKPLQAIPLVESGGADRFGLDARELAVACGSHAAEPEHLAAVRSVLSKAGLDDEALQCGAHAPGDPVQAAALVRAGRQPGPIHNNCSGKHAGFVCLACAEGLDPAGYVGPDHPVQRAVTEALAQVTGAALGEHNRAIDGCSIPAYAIPLRALAFGFARFATGRGLPAERARAAARIRAAVAANPTMVAGQGRFDTEVMTILGARAFTKTGAEGVFCGALPEAGLGIAIKCDDGVGRAAESATAAVIARILTLDAAERAFLTRFVRPSLRNWNGIVVGELRPTEVLLGVVEE